MAITLTDLAPKRVPVELNGVACEITGLTLGDFAELLASFPEAAGLVQGGTIDPAALLQSMPQLAGWIVAAGLGFAKDQRVEGAGFITAWPAGETLAALQAVIEATFPPSRGGVMGQLARLASAIGLERVPVSPEPTAPMPRVGALAAASPS